MPQQSLYAMGYKYCSRCQTFYKTSIVRCIDCNTKLRSKPRPRKQANRTADEEPGRSWLITRKDRFEQYIERLLE